MHSPTAPLPQVAASEVTPFLSKQAVQQVGMLGVPVPMGLYGVLLETGAEEELTTYEDAGYEDGAGAEEDSGEEGVDDDSAGYEDGAGAEEDSGEEGVEDDSTGTDEELVGPAGIELLDTAQ